MSAVWYNSDLHIGHRVVSVARAVQASLIQCPTHSSDEHAACCVSWHDDTLARNWDKLVAANDTVFVLGDISGGGTAAQRAALKWLSQRPGRKHLVSGNHDGVHPSHRDADKWVAAYHEVFLSVFPFRRRRIAGNDVLLSHYPYDGDHIGHDRDIQYRLPDMGLPVIHGHTHTASVEETSDRFTSVLTRGICARRRSVKSNAY